MCADTILWLAGGTADPDQVTRLIGVNEAMHQITGLAHSVWEHTPFAPGIVALRARLDEKSVASARKDGYALSLQQMAEVALEVLDQAVAGASERRAEPKGVSRHGLLSARELEVLRLVAEGLSNREVAGRLFVTERTVRSHLTSIFGKLGADNRTQAVALARLQSLL
jgi:DNA-binding NarL/FixJ family response regulator